MLVVVEELVARPDPGDKPAMAQHTPAALGVAVDLEEVLQLVEEVALLKVYWLPAEHVFPKRLAVIQDLDGRVRVANI